MAVEYSPHSKSSSISWWSRSAHFRRGKRKVKTRKIQRKIKLKFKHIWLAFLILVGIFYALQQTYLFLISWEKLEIQGTEVICAQPDIKNSVINFLEGKKLGNIFLVNIQSLQQILESHSWIKEVRIRKIFPSSLKIYVTPRTPVALWQKEQLYLIDEQGVIIEQTKAEDYPSLPLLIDSQNFQKNSSEKLDLALKMLQDISLPQKRKIEVIDVSEYKNVSVKLKSSSEWIKLGNDRFSSKLQLYHQLIPKYQKKYGPLKYVDLRFFENQLIIKPAKSDSLKPSHSYKEAK